MLVWRLKNLQRIKILLSRAARSCLSTRENLRRQHVPCDQHCLMCDADLEDEIHLFFFKCQHATVAWHLSGIFHVVNNLIYQAISFKDSFFNLPEVLTSGQVNFAMMFWVLRKRRNERVWENISKPIAISVQLAMDYVRDWQLVRRRPDRVEETVTSS